MEFENVNIECDSITATHGEEVRVELCEYIKRLCKNLDIFDYEGLLDIEFEDTLTSGASGYCGGDETICTVSIAWNDQVGIIEIAEIKRHLAHECIHAQQIMSGKLINEGLRLCIDENDNKAISYVVIWKGEEFINTPYYERPWERQAYGNEVRMMEESSC